MAQFSIREVLLYILRDKKFYMLLLLMGIAVLISSTAIALFGIGGIFVQLVMLVLMLAISVTMTVYAIHVYNTLYGTAIKSTARRRVRYL